MKKYTTSNLLLQGLALGLLGTFSLTLPTKPVLDHTNKEQVSKSTGTARVVWGDAMPTTDPKK